MRHIKQFENASNNRYIAIFKQNGEGCDYTIECGTDWISLNASNEMDAIKEVELIITGNENEEHEMGDEIHSGYTGDRELSDVKIFEVSKEINFEVEDLYKQLKEEDEKFQSFRKEEQDRQRYQRLHKRFGGKHH